MFLVAERRTANKGIHHHCVRGNHEFIDQEYERLFLIDEFNQPQVFKFCSECGGGR